MCVYVCSVINVYVASKYQMTVNNELKRKWQEVVTVCVKVALLSCNWPVVAECTTEGLQFFCPDLSTILPSTRHKPYHLSQQFA